jgi:hypothetical protein
MSGVVERMEPPAGPAEMGVLANSVAVVLRGIRWAVVRGLRVDPVSIHDVKADAVRAARELAERIGGEVVVYGLDGRPQDPNDDTARIWR